MKKFVALAALLTIAGLSLSGCGKKQPAAVLPPPKVTVARPLVEKLADWDDYIGQFQAVQTVEIRPRVSGYLTQIHFTDGQTVKQGELLFTIDPRPFKAKLEQARGQLNEVRATLANLRIQLKRQKKLITTNSVSQEQYDATEAQVKAAEAQLTAARAAVLSAQLDVGFTEVRAPVDGRVSYHQVDVGNAVKADDTILTTVTSVDPIRFVFQGSEAQYLRFKRQYPDGHYDQVPVRIKLQDENSYRWKGHVDFMDTMIDTGSGTIRGRAVIPNPKGFLVPGMFGHMQLQAVPPHKSILIPDTAVATLAGNRVVYIVAANGKVAARPITLGPLHGSLRVIRSGLTENDHVIVNGQLRARPGQKVNPTMTTIKAPDTAEAGATSSE